MWPVSWGHQCCESPAAFGCVVVMCVVGWGRSDDSMEAQDHGQYCLICLGHSKQES